MRDSARRFSLLAFLKYCLKQILRGKSVRGIVGALPLRPQGFLRRSTPVRDGVPGFKATTSPSTIFSMQARSQSSRLRSSSQM